jgi:acylphosphatase
VQGVWFRAFVADAARRHDVTGFARNEADGSVLVELEGDRDSVGAVLDQCRTGPPRARVDRVAIQDITPQGSNRFAER